MCVIVDYCILATCMCISNVYNLIPYPGGRTCQWNAPQEISLAPSQTPSRETTPHDNLDDSVSPLPPPLPPLGTSNNKVQLYCVHLDSIQL